MSEDEQVRGDVIKRSFDALDVLGSTLKEEMIAYLERRGNPLDADHTYTLKEMKIELGAVFGDDAAAVLVDRLRRGVDAAKSLLVLAAPVAGLLAVSVASNPARFLAF